MSKQSEKLKTPRYRKLHELGPLHDLLLKCSPVDDKNEKSIPLLAEKLNISNTAIYKWIENKSVPAKKINTLVTLSNGAVTREEFDVFVFGQTE